LHFKLNNNSNTVSYQATSSTVVRPRVNILNVHNIMYNVYIHVNNSCGISKQIVLTSTKMKQNKKQTYKKKPF
jgi:hypothetical protein